MRALAALVVLYLFFLIQASIAPWFPDLVLLALVAISLHESRTASALLGAFAGLCLDMTSPTFAGASLLLLASVGYGVALLRSFFYRARWATLLFVLAALALKWTILAAAGPGLPDLPALLISSVLALLLAPLAELGLGRLLYRGWQPA